MRILILVSLLFIAGCDNTPPVPDSNWLPTNAINVKDLGNRWKQFELNGKWFIVYSDGYRRSIAQIDSPIK